ncbi:MAG TPA: LLM class flavin-dependent oxidoreductase [Jatrophihabitantaceae bacterium]|jgi:alkanesulfonate monooxygenase SsuD/methylene tetrahydromethanopterin reductase-like flavin-dependent oxidoreductase (luciferase family)
MVASPPPDAGILVGSWPLGMPSAPSSFYATLPRRVEELGFDALFTGDHLFAAGPSVDALAIAAAFAARTEMIIVGTGVLQLGLREPVAAAKQIATIDCLSDGRFVLGVGVGGEFEDEWAAAGVPRENRGRRLDDYLDLAASLWTGERVEYDGEFASVHGVVGSPRPARGGPPPIWVGGRTDAALARAARYDGWLAYAASTRRVRESVAKLAELRAELRVDPQVDGSDFTTGTVLWTYVAASVETARDRIAQILGTRYRQDFDNFVEAFCAVGPVDEIARRVAEFREAGTSLVLCSPQCLADEFLDQVEQLAEVPGLRRP